MVLTAEERSIVKDMFEPRVNRCLRGIRTNTPREILEQCIHRRWRAVYDELVNNNEISPEALTEYYNVMGPKLTNYIIDLYEYRNRNRSTRRGTARRGSTRRGSTRRGSTRRGTARRGTVQRTSRGSVRHSPRTH